MDQIRLHCLSWDMQTDARACFLTLARAGIKMPIKRAIIAITTSSSIKVNAFFDMIILIISYSLIVSRL